MAETESSAFWAFTLESYRREGVQPAVIGLQDRRGADVNLLFFCCYLAASGRGRLDEAAIARAEATIEPWRRQVTQPLRALRDRIKGTETLWTLAGAPEVRGKVLGAEIESERIAQGLLESLAPEPEDSLPPMAARLEDARASFDVYLRFLSVEPDDGDREALSTLLRGTFPKADVDG